MSAPPVRLTSFASCAGCAAKLGGAELTAAVGGLRRVADDRLLVGPESMDDAAVYQVADDFALVQTVDFFPPIVDDPRLFGEIAAANALSDVYAMGGQPLTALNIVAFPMEELGAEVLAEILAGAEAKVHEAGALVVGGHTILDPQVKFGLAVVGRAHPGFLLTNGAARTGDQLVLTKPLGSGLVTTALRDGVLDSVGADDALTAMRMLNGAASRAALGVGARCATDVTGFGLLGHALHVARASDVTLRIHTARVPVFAGVSAALAADVRTAGGERNLRFVAPYTAWNDATMDVRALLCDPQTSGGLLIALAPERAERFQSRVPGAIVIGDVIPRERELLLVD